MENRDRFKDAIWAQEPKGTNIIIGGQGGIGSWLTLFLSRIGYTLITYDDDSFDNTNISGQFVDLPAININKAQAINILTKRFGATNRINVFAEKYDDESLATGFMMGAFDNMEARTIMFDKWFAHNADMGNQDALLIDGRLNLEHFQIFCVTPQNTKKYRDEYLFNDDEANDAACTLKQTSHTAAMIGALMTGLFTNHITNVIEKNKARTVPFKTEFFLPLNMMDNEF